MKLKSTLLTIFIALSGLSFAADCDCKGNELVYACQDGETKRVICSSLQNPDIHCGPCEEKKAEPACADCPADENGIITLCWIPTTKTNFKTVRGTCDYVQKFFDDNGELKGKNKCGPCTCEMIGDRDTDGDGVCDSKDECPDNPDKSKAGSCGCESQDSDSDGVCDKDDICEGHPDNMDTDGDGIPDGCDTCPEDTDLPASEDISCDDGNPNTTNDDTSRYL